MSNISEFEKRRLAQGGVNSRITAWQNPNQQKKHYYAGKVTSIKSFRQKLGRHGDDYGTPEEGSRTDYRGRRAGDEISGEVVELCYVILNTGYCLPNGTYAVTFGVLFEMYTKISNKVVGMLMRARKHGLIQFKGEMLYQRRDEDVVIFLVKIPADLAEEAQRKGATIPIHYEGGEPPTPNAAAGVS